MYSKIIYIATATLVLLTACQAENQFQYDFKEDIDKLSESTKTKAPDVTAIQGENKSTKSTLEVDGEGVGTIYWTPADEINVFYGTTSTHYVSQNAVNATTAVFSTTDVIGSTESASENIWGLYPYNSSATCTGSAVTTTLPATQYGVPGTFDDDLFITLAHNTSTALTFYNVCGGIKFSLSRDDISSISFRGNNNEDIAGELSLNFSDGVPNINVISGQRVITITPKTGSTFISGEYYYLILRPIVLSNGFTMKFTTSTGKEGIFNYSSTAVNIKRSMFSRKANIDTYALFPAPSNQIWYTSTDSNIIEPLASAFSANIVSNVYSNSKGVITFDADITTIGTDAFGGKATLSSICLPESLISIGDHAFASDGNLKSVYIPDGVTRIYPYAFYNCEQLSSISLPQGLQNINEYAFAYCNLGLRSITIPPSVKSIGSHAFYCCLNLNYVYFQSSPSVFDCVFFAGPDNDRCFHVDDLETWIKIGSKTGFYDSSSWFSPHYRLFINNEEVNNLIIPNDVDIYEWTLGSGFYGCSSIRTVTVPLSTVSVEAIPTSEFENCSNLLNVTLKGPNIQRISSRAFYNCANLGSVVFGDNYFYSLKYIDAGAFYNCDLSSLTITRSVSAIAHSAFMNNSTMTRIDVLPDTPPSLGDNVFTNTNNCYIYIYNNYSSYSGDSSWSAFGGRMRDWSYDD